jgi:hypothetical protein
MEDVGLKSICVAFQILDTIRQSCQISFRITVHVYVRSVLCRTIISFTSSSTKITRSRVNIYLYLERTVSYF